MIVWSQVTVISCWKKCFQLHFNSLRGSKINFHLIFNICRPMSFYNIQILNNRLLEESK